MDRHARKQVLLARIAYERIELRRDIARVQQAASPLRWLRGAMAGTLGASLFGEVAAAGQRGWLPLGLALLKRYRLVAGLMAGVAPLLGGRRGWRRVVRWGVVGAAAWLGWRIVKGRGDARPS